MPLVLVGMQLWALNIEHQLDLRSFQTFNIQNELFFLFKSL